MLENNINPIFFHIGPISLRYYGLMYAVGMIIGYFILRHLLHARHIRLEGDEFDSYYLQVIIGGLLGARIFYCLIYNLPYYFANPIEVIYIWNGGMSFHGGIIGGITAGWIYCRSHGKDTLAIADATVIPFALALFFGRIGNFLNQELVGRLSSVPWCVKFHGHEGCRHPSQLYEAAKNLIIFAVLSAMYPKKYRKGTVFAVFIIMYAALRFFTEYFRQPDVQVGYIFGLTMGQIISIFTLAGGIIFYLHILRIFGGGHNA